MTGLVLFVAGLVLGSGVTVLGAWLALRRAVARLTTRVDAAEAESARLRDVIRHEVAHRRGWQIKQVTEHAIGAGRAA
jgi:hypothetical protein